MSERSDGERMADIREAIRRIRAYLGEMTYEAFSDDTKTQDSVLRNLEVIGEACRHLSERTKAAAPEIPWKSMAGMRDRLIHDYAGVNLDIVWQVVSVELPALAGLVEALSEESGSDEG